MVKFEHCRLFIFVVPLEEDVEVFSDYLLQLIGTQNLEQLWRVMKFLDRYFFLSSFISLVWYRCVPCPHGKVRLPYHQTVLFVEEWYESPGTSPESTLSQQVAFEFIPALRALYSLERRRHIVSQFFCSQCSAPSVQETSTVSASFFQFLTPWIPVTRRRKGKERKAFCFLFHQQLCSLFS